MFLVHLQALHIGSRHALETRRLLHAHLDSLRNLLIELIPEIDLGACHH